VRGGGRDITSHEGLIGDSDRFQRGAWPKKLLAAYKSTPQQKKKEEPSEQKGGGGLLRRPNARRVLHVSHKRKNNGRMLGGSVTQARRPCREGRRKEEAGVNKRRGEWLQKVKGEVN